MPASTCACAFLGASNDKSHSLPYRHAIARSAFSAAKARAAGIDNVYIFDDDALQVQLARLDFAYAFDAVSTPCTVRWLCGVLATSASCTFSVLAGGVLDDVAALARANCPPHVDIRTTNAGATSQTPGSPYAETVRHWLSQAGALVLAGEIQTQPRQVLAGGLARVPDGLCMLREGRAGSRKLVCECGFSRLSPGTDTSDGQMKWGVCTDRLLDCDEILFTMTQPSDASW